MMDEKITFELLSHRILVCRGPGPLSNSAAFIGDREVLLADTMLTPAMAHQVRMAVREVTDRPIRFVLNTHRDGDHVFGNQEFWPECVFLSHRTTRDLIRDAGDKPVRDAAARRPHLKAEFDLVRVIAPQVAFDGNLEIDLGGLAVHCLHVGPAHTPGDVAVWVPAERFLLTGDVVFNGAFPGMRSAHIGGWLRALDRLEALEPRTVAPGHGAIGGPPLIAQQRAVLVEFRDLMLEARGRGLTLEEAMASIRLVDHKELPLVDERMPEAIRSSYDSCDQD